MSRPRICIAIAHFLPLIGGAEKQALMQARALRERGYEVTIVTLRHDRAWPRREMIAGVPIVRIAGRLVSGRARRPGLLRKLSYFAGMVVMGWTFWRRRQSYDVLHVFQLNLMALPAAVVCEVTGKPLIVALRSVGSSEPESVSDKGSLVDYTSDAKAAYLQVDTPGREGDLHQLEQLGKPVVCFTRSLLERIGAVVVVLSSRSEKYLSVSGFTLPNTELIPNGVDITRFAPSCSCPSDSERKQVVICVSTLRYAKGIDVLLRAWRLVHQQEQGARLRIVGGGPLRAQLERLAVSLEIMSSVEFLGEQSNVVAHLHRAGLAVLSSRREGMPNALLEAMACGLPCVATRVSGSEDIIQHGVNGLLVEPEDEEVLAEALLSLLRNPALAQKYGRAARATVEEHYSLERVTERYVELYHRVAYGDRTRTAGEERLVQREHRHARR